MNINSKPTALPIIVAATACVNSIPTKLAENTLIASPIPRFPGVMAITMDKLLMDAMNNAFVNSISIPRTL